eukprot:11133587-Karenia_brevis.AAC.1
MMWSGGLRSTPMRCFQLFGLRGGTVASLSTPPGGVPNTSSSILSFLEHFSLGSWNARALLHFDASKRARKKRE